MTNVAKDSGLMDVEECNMEYWFDYNYSLIMFKKRTKVNKKVDFEEEVAQIENHHES